MIENYEPTYSLLLLLKLDLVKDNVFFNLSDRKSDTFG